MKRRDFFLMVATALLGKPLFARLLLPIVDDLSDLPDGVPGLLRHQPFAFLGANNDYFVPAVGQKILALRSINKETGERYWFAHGSTPYPHVSADCLCDALARNSGDRFRWMTVAEFHKANH